MKYVYNNSPQILEAVPYTYGEGVQWYIRLDTTVYLFPEFIEVSEVAQKYHLFQLPHSGNVEYATSIQWH